jgi:hypothetical protein
MTSPTAIAGVGMGASAGGSLLGFLGAKQEGAAQSQMYQYQGGIAQLNKKIALQNADYAREVGEQESVRYGMKARFAEGKTKAAQGASGIDLGSGSSVDVRTSQHDIAQMDLATIRNNAARKAYGYEVEGVQDEAQSNLYGMAASNAEKAGNIKAMGSLISGVSSVSSKWLQGQSVGIYS